MIIDENQLEALIQGAAASAHMNALRLVEVRAPLETIRKVARRIGAPILTERLTMHVCTGEVDLSPSPDLSLIMRFAP
jgi:hypothetical protein